MTPKRLDYVMNKRMSGNFLAIRNLSQGRVWPRAMVSTLAHGSELCSIYTPASPALLDFCNDINTIRQIFTNSRLHDNLAVPRLQKKV